MSKFYVRSHRKAEMIRAEERTARVEEMLLQGHAYSHIAGRLGISKGSVANHARKIEQRYREENAAKLGPMRDRQIKRLEYAMQKAIESYFRSRQDVIQLTTTYTPRACRACRGTGMKPGSDRWCEDCSGDGTTMEEVVTRTVRGQAGDSSFLREYRECVRELSRLLGLNPPKKPRRVAVEGKVVHAHLHGGRIDLSGASSETVLEAKAALDKLMLESKAKQPMIGGEEGQDDDG